MIYIVGIPYAKPPIGDLRFAKPQPFGKFTDGYLNGTEFGSICAQFRNSKPAGDEDCLFLNIYTPAQGQMKVYIGIYIPHAQGWMKVFAYKYYILERERAS